MFFNLYGKLPYKLKKSVPFLEQLEEIDYSLSSVDLLFFSLHHKKITIMVCALMP